MKEGSSSTIIENTIAFEAAKNSLETMCLTCSDGGGGRGEVNPNRQIQIAFETFVFSQKKGVGTGDLTHVTCESTQDSTFLISTYFFDKH